ncbi:MAG: hypothetical protein Kilf2KO_24290 [Rhodospirillales bacterium]
MSSIAPYDYVEWYYENDFRLRSNFPDVTAFVDSFVACVEGDRVLNAGCGPQFLDLLSRFGRAPSEYVGIDIGRETIRFVEESQDERVQVYREIARKMKVQIEAVCDDIFTWPGLKANRFDCIIAIGFIGTFHGERLNALLAHLHRSLRKDGRLIKLTWHGPHRTPEQTAKKLEYGYDSLEEHDPKAFLQQIEAAGFEVRQHELMVCDPKAYRWDVVQGCVFDKHA